MTRGASIVLTFAATALPWACAGGSPGPAALEVGRDTCAYCRMTVLDRRLAAQLVAPGEEPRFFDDIGCLANDLRNTRALPSGAVTYVAEHRTGDWVPAAEAVYTRAGSLSTPMGSGMIAHRASSSRDDDPDARGGAQVSLTEVFGPSGPPRGLP